MNSFVDYVLESSVRREGSRIRATAQLIRVNDQTHVWAASFDRQDASDLNMQSEIGKAIADQIRIKLEGPTSSVFRFQTHDANAFDLYLRGRYYWNQLTPGGIRRGIEYFDQAVASDPNYAQAYAGLADCWAVLPITSEVPALEAVGKATNAARKAVELDDCLAEGHSSIGAIALWMEWDWQRAESALQRALERNPSYVTAHRWYGHLLSDLGRHEEAASEMTIARQLDPLSPIIHGLSGNLFYQAREYDKALLHLDHALALNTDLWVLHIWRSKVYERQGNLEAGMKACQKAFDLSGGNTEPISLKGYIQARLGNRDEAVKAIAMLAELSSRRYVPAWNVAMVYAGLGESDHALDWLERAYETRDVRMTFLGVEPKWDFVRGHFRFQNLLQRLSLLS